MEILKSNQSKNQMSALTEIGAALAKLEAPTNESVIKAVGGILTANAGDIKALISFTGYYGLATAENAFLSIDTSEIYINYPITQKQTIRLQVPTVTINVSLDGKTVTQYPFDKNASFDGKTLIIKDAVKLTLTRGYKAGELVTLSGTVGASAVAGSTFFNPVKLPVFVGNYKALATQKTILSVADSAIEFDFGSGLKNVTVFSYNPAMYVVEFMNSAATYTLMLGTSEKQGLACFITDGTANNFAVTIP